MIVGTRCATLLLAARLCSGLAPPRPAARVTLRRLGVARAAEGNADEMRTADIKAELDLRGVAYNDCFELGELRKRLKEARLSGKADAKILDKFNRVQAEQMLKAEPSVAPSAEDLESLKGSDGTIPGGLNPEEMAKLMSDPKIMTMLQKPKFQEIMQATMTGGPEKLHAFYEDPEAREMLQTVAKLLQGAGMAPPDAPRRVSTAPSSAPRTTVGQRDAGP